MVNSVNNITIFDITMGMYPCKIFDINMKPEKGSNIDVSTDDSNVESIRILETTPPNIVYSPHIRFVTLENIC